MQRFNHISVRWREGKLKLAFINHSNWQKLQQIARCSGEQYDRTYANLKS